MNEWLIFWKLLCIINVVVYYLMAVILVPMAIRDMIILIRKLNINKNQTNETDIKKPEQSK